MCVGEGVLWSAAAFAPEMLCVGFCKLPHQALPARGDTEPEDCLLVWFSKLLASVLLNIIFSICANERKTGEG